MEATTEQIKEYETQLADVEELLKAQPDDAALLSLKKDLNELLALTKASLPSSEQAPQIETTSANVQEETETGNDGAAASLETAVPGKLPSPQSATEAAGETATTAAALPAKKKKLKLKDFEIPEHLRPKEGDTEAETNRKKRAVKQLKKQWNSKKKDVEATKKQQSWQSFQKKKKRKDKESIFATQDGKSMTEFGERKRHKHS